MKLEKRLKSSRFFPITKTIPEVIAKRRLDEVFRVTAFDILMVLGLKIGLIMNDSVHFSCALKVTFAFFLRFLPEQETLIQRDF